MGFHLEDGGEAVAYVHGAGVFSGALQNLRRVGGQALQMDAARFVGAVLAPHDAENSEFGEVRVAAQDFTDTVIFLGGEPVLGNQFRCDVDFSIEHACGCNFAWRWDVPPLALADRGHLARQRCNCGPKNYQAVGGSVRRA